MIIFDEKSQVFRLDTPDTSYCMGIFDGKYLGHIYYGRKIDDTDIKNLIQVEGTCALPSENPAEKGSFMGTFPMEYPTSGLGDFRENCLDIIDSHGQNGLELCFDSYEILDKKPELPGMPSSFGETCDNLKIILKDAAHKISVELYYSVFLDEDVITRSVKICNNGNENIHLTEALSACLSVQNQDYEVLSLHGTWARERHLQRMPVGYGAYTAESVRGEEGHTNHPFLGLLTQNCTETTGEVYAMNFVYSGNFIAKVEMDPFDSIRMVMGIHPKNFSWNLEPGQYFTAPEVVLTYSACGLEKMTHTFHDFYRKHMIRSIYKDKERPIMINNWEATYFDFDDQKILNIAKTAKQCGIELMVMDDGWFGKHREEPTGSLGDWYANEKKLHGPLSKLVDSVTALGMKFGIWVEPEMVSEDSDLFRKHPDWILKTDKRAAVLCRDQYLLDLSRPEVVDYIFESLEKLLKSADISYLKWDMNRSLIDLGSTYLPKERQGEISHRHVLGVYAIQERLVTEFPDLLFENCSSGGARFDPGMFYYSPQIWCSDNMDPVERLEITEGTALIYPLSTIGSHVCGAPNDISKRSTPLKTRGIISMLGNFGYELDITKLSEKDKEEISRQIQTYKKIAPLIQGGDYYRIASYASNKKFDCVEITDSKKEKACLIYMQVLSDSNGRGRIVKLRGLDKNKKYKADGKIYYGSTLMNAGLVIEKSKGDFYAGYKIIEQVAE